MHIFIGKMAATLDFRVKMAKIWKKLTPEMDFSLSRYQIDTSIVFFELNFPKIADLGISKTSRGRPF